jgi:hypothetical protein
MYVCMYVCMYSTFVFVFSSFVLGMWYTWLTFQDSLLAVFNVVPYKPPSALLASDGRFVQWGKRHSYSLPKGAR